MSEKPTGLERDLAMALGDHLRELRNKAGLTQEQAAERAQMTRNHYQVLENARTSHGDSPNPTLKSIINIAEALDVSLTEVLKPILKTKY